MSYIFPRYPFNDFEGNDDENNFDPTDADADTDIHKSKDNTVVVEGNLPKMNLGKVEKES